MVGFVPYFFNPSKKQHYMDAHDYASEKELLTAMEKKDIKAFMRFYKEYRDDLIIFTFCIVQDVQLANRTVDNLFEQLWFESKFHQITPPIHKFLLTEIRKICVH